MSQNSELKNGGAATMKAFMIAAATDDVTGNGVFYGEEYGGEGGIDFESSYNPTVVRTITKPAGQRGNQFPAINDNWDCDTQTSFTANAGEKVSAAISWISDPDYAMSHQTSDLDLNLYITDNAGNWYYTSDPQNPYDNVKYTAQGNRTHTVYICKMNDYATTNPLKLGLVVIKY